VRELEAFSYTVAHDLRAPLRAIDGYTGHLSQSLLGDAGDTEGLLGKIRRNVGSMERLIDGLLNYARLGRQGLRGASVDMAALAGGVAATVAETHPGVSIEVGSVAGAFGDAEMLRQVWTNLIDNACKFAGASVAPRVEIGSRRDETGWIYFVRDNGVGIDMRYAHRLFRVFERLHNDPRFAGSGVGLAIVHRIVQRHGGSIWAEGEPGRGATFHFRIPEVADAEASLVGQ
jgi:light-regulated signal transduction histidine kinase (bacteriophytochrome)